MRSDDLPCYNVSDFIYLGTTQNRLDQVLNIHVERLARGDVSIALICKHGLYERLPLRFRSCADFELLDDAFARAVYVSLSACEPPGGSD